jgi:ABC-type multidrug transport system ATPase subunit
MSGAIVARDLEANLAGNDGGLSGEAREGILIGFENVDYSVQVKKEEKQILSNVSGFFAPGKMTALMGPSGSGKTTLLDCIAGRKNAGNISGKVTYNGSTPTARMRKQKTAYVEQFDTLVAELTVHEMLMYAAELKLPESVTTAQKEERVANVLDQLQLNDCKDTVIGNELCRGISGGQCKRTNIALSVLTQPEVLFLDEPTTGLDSFMANEVVLILKRLAENGRTICATIHSPTSFAFNQFDNLIMLKAGSVIYSGPIADDAIHARRYFQQQGFQPPSADAGLFFSTVEWLVEVTSGKGLTALQKGASKGEGTDFAQFYSASADGAAANHKALQSALALASTNASLSADVDDAPTAEVLTSTFHGIKTLLRYRTATHYKSPEFLGPRFGDKILFGLLILSLYWGIGDKQDAQSIQSTASLLYFIIALCGYGAAAFVPSLTLDRPLYYRERADGYYTTFTYYVAKFIEEALIATITSLVFGTIVFFGCNLQGSFWIFIAVYFLTSMIGIVLAYAVAAAVPTMDAANALLPTYVTFCMYFGGLFLLFDKIPLGWRWFSYTTFLRYAWSAMMVNQFHDEANGAVAAFGGQDVLTFYGLHDGIAADIGISCGILIAIMLVFAILGGLALSRFKHITR